MFSVFSDRVLERLRLIENAQSKQRCSEHLLRDAYHHLIDTVEGGYPHVIVFYDDKDIADRILYENCINSELRKVTLWITKNILTVLNDLHYKTFGVRIRIATGMVNKLVNEGKLDSTLAFYVHEGFVKNLRDLKFDLEVESLPF